ncbi:MAG TPA: hypothetical protein VN753_10360, partial [Terracidiphilus sp.]|nr:hypothetical protein [Terracidiphilus sp.]
KNEQIEIGDAGKDQMRADTPNETDKLESAVTNARGSELVNSHVRVEQIHAGSKRSRENEVNLVLFRIEVTSQSLDDMLGSAATQVRNQQANPGALRQGHESARGSVPKTFSGSK